MTAKRSRKPLEVVADDVEARSLLAQIDTGNNLALTAWATRRLASVLAVSIDRRTAHGRTTAIVAETPLRRDQMDDLLELCEVNNGNFSPRKYSRLDFLEAVESSIKENEDWFDRLDLLLVPCVEDSLRRPFEWEHLFYRLHDRCLKRGLARPQVVLIISHRDLAEPALRRNFPIFDLNDGYVQGRHSSHESAFGGNPVKHLWWTLWAAEDLYLHKLLPVTPSSDFGVEPVLAYYAGGHQIFPSNYRVDDSAAMEDQLESLQHRLTQLRKRPWEQLMSGTEDGYFVRAHACSAEAVRDPAANPWRLLRAMAEDGGEALLAGVVVPPTVLRGYLISNAAYYGSAPLEPLTPRMLNSVNDTAAQIYLRLKNAGTRVALDEIRLALVRSGAVMQTERSDAFALLRKHFAALFGQTVANRLKAEALNQWEPSADFASGSFVRRTWVNLDSSKRSEDVAWLDVLKVEAEGIANADSVRRDHVYQLYPPGQQCCIAGKLFRVSAIEHDRVRVRKVAEPEVMTRLERTVCVNDPLSRISLEMQAPIRGNGFEFRCEALELPFRVSSGAWWESADFGGGWRHLAQQQPERVYRPGRALRLVLSKPDGASLWSAGQRLALVQWLNEAAPTLLPESQLFFIAATCVEVSELPQAEPAHSIVPKLEFIGETDILDKSAIWIFEDSHADLGIVGACKDRMEWILNLCLDYLVWQADEAASVAEETRCSLNRERLAKDFMTYGHSALDPAFDYAGLRQVLATSGLFTDRTSLTSNRHQFIERLRQAAEADAFNAGTGSDAAPTGTFGGADSQVGPIDSTVPVCDFCGTSITAQGELLQDGRHRCTRCSAVGVDSVAEAQKLCDQVLGEFSSVFGRELRVPVHIQFATASQIAIERGEEFLPTSSFDQRAVGLACTKSDSGYKIFIEQGHAMTNISMTLVHELTHIWQYVWIDFARLSEEQGKLLIEGHASWAEIKYARYKAANAGTRDERLLWEQAMADQENGLMQRSDEYGQGYRQLMRAVGVDGDAFGWLAGLYPKSV